MRIWPLPAGLHLDLRWFLLFLCLAQSTFGHDGSSENLAEELASPLRQAGLFTCRTRTSLVAVGGRFVLWSKFTWVSHQTRGAGQRREFSIPEPPLAQASPHPNGLP